MTESIPQRTQALRGYAAFLFCNGLLWALLGARYYAIAPPAPTPSAIAFAVLLGLTHMPLLPTLVLSPLLPLAWTAGGRAVLPGIAALVAALLGWLAVIDGFVFAQYRYHLNGMVLDLLLGGAANEIFQFSAAVWFEVLGLALGWVLVQGALAWMCWRGPGMGWLGMIRPLSFAWLGGLVLAHLWFALADLRDQTGVTAQRSTLPAFLPLTAKQTLSQFGWGRDESLPQIPAEAGHLAYPAQALECRSSAQALNLLLIVVDSLRADMLEAETMPQTAAYARNAWRFERHQSMGNATRNGVFSLMYGIPGTYWQAMLAERRGAALVQQAQRAGYQLGIYASAKLTSPEFDRTVFATVPSLRKQSQGATPSLRDRDATAGMLEFLDRAQPNQPFFGFLFYDAPHGYDVPSDVPPRFVPEWSEIDFMALDQNTDPTPFRNRYRNAVHFIDGEIGRILGRLRERGLERNTVVVITSDHGQEFNDNQLNFWGHNSNFSPAQIQVPLLVHWPGQPAQGFRHRTSHFDVAPTLLQEVFGCANAFSASSSGRHLRDPDPARLLLAASFNQIALVEPDYTVLVDEFGRVALKDPRWRDQDGEYERQRLLLATREMSRFFRH